MRFRKRRPTPRPIVTEVVVESVEASLDRKVRLVATSITDVHGQDYADREKAIRDCLPRDGSPMTDEQRAVFEAYVSGGRSVPLGGGDSGWKPWLTYDPLTLKSRRGTRYWPSGRY